MDNEFQRGQMTAQLEILLAKVTRLDEAVDALKTLPSRMDGLEAVVRRIEAPVLQLSTARAQAMAVWASFATVATMLATVGMPLVTWIKGK